MVKGFDNLVELLLEKIALRGQQGFAYNDACAIIEEYYSKRLDDHASAFGTFGQAPGSPTVDSLLFQSVWKWLIAHPDTEIHESKQHVENCIIRATSARMWHEIAGHDVDFTRIRKLEFDLLSIIAAHGENGISQPELITLSGQDKRSLPGRTDALCQNGYITKEFIHIKGMRTSLLTLRRFVRDVAVQPFSKELPSVSSPDQQIFRNGTILPDELLNLTVALLKEVEVITLRDYRKHLGIFGKRWESRVVFKLLYRMELIGCIKRIGVPVTGAGRKTAVLRSIKFIEEPTEAARQAFHDVRAIDAKEFQARPVDTPDDDDDGDTFEVDIKDDDEDLLDCAAEGSAGQPRTPPQWTTDRAIHNLVFDLVNRKGPQGISTMELADGLGGPFWKRPLDHILAHLTDVWQESQPSHLRHLAIVRDAAVADKYNHYFFRTYNNFQAAVRNGIASWEAVIDGYKDVKPGSLDTFEAQSLQLNSMGFPEVSPTRLLRLAGGATASDCRRAVKVEKQSLTPLSTLLRKLDTSTVSEVSIHQMRKTSLNPFHKPADANKKPRSRQTEHSMGEGQHQGKNRLVSKDSKLMADFKIQTREWAERIVRKEWNGNLPAPLAMSSSGLHAPDWDYSIDANTNLHDPLPSNSSNRNARNEVAQNDDTMRPGKRAKLYHDTPAEKSRTLSGIVDTSLCAGLKSDIYVQTETTDENSITNNSYVHSPTKDDSKVRVVVSSSRCRGNKTFSDMTLVPTHSKRTAPTETDEVRERKRPRSGVVYASKENAALTQRLEEVQAELLSMTKPGLYINPPGSERRNKSAGRFLKAMTVVIKMERLQELEWFQSLQQSSPSVTPAVPQCINHQDSPVRDNIHEPGELAETNPTVQCGRPASSTDQPFASQQANVLGQTAEAYRKVDTLQPLELDSAETTKNGIGSVRNDPIPPTSPSPQINPAIPVNKVHSSRTQGSRGSASPSAIHEQRSSYLLDDSRLAPTKGESSGEIATNLDKPWTSDECEALSAGETILGESPNKSSQVKSRKRTGVTLGAGTIRHKRTELISRIVKEAGGAFPNGKEMWYTFVAASRKDDPKAKLEPSTVNRAVKSAIDSGKLRRITFAFHNKDGVTCTKQILTPPGIAADSDVVKRTQAGMINSHPGLYLPEGIEIDPILKVDVDGVAGRRQAFPLDTEAKVTGHLFPRDQLGPSSKNKRTLISDNQSSSLQADACSSEEDISEEQAAMQSAFVLPSYNHNAGAALPTWRKPKERLSKLMPWSRKAKLEVKPNTSSIRALAKDSSHLHSLTTESSTLASSGHHGVHYSPLTEASVLMPHSQGFSKMTAEGFAIRQKDALEQHHKRLLKNQLHSSSSRSQSLRLSDPSSRMTSSRESSTKGFGYYRTLTDPKQTLHTPTGTFSTEFLFDRKVHPVLPTLAIRPELQREFEDKLPQSLEDLISRQHMAAPQKCSRKDMLQFDYEIKQVQQWEEDNAANMMSKQQLICPRFINHTIPADVVTQVCWSKDEHKSRSRFPRPEIQAAQSSKTAVGIHTIRPSRLAEDKQERAIRKKPTTEAPHVSLAGTYPNIVAPIVLRPKLKRNRLPRNMTLFSEAQTQRLLVIIIVIRTLTGGVDRQTDWQLVQKLLNTEHDAAFLRRRWAPLYRLYRLHINKMQSDFQDAFIKAYEGGEIDAIDFNNPSSYDWESLVDWAQGNVDVPTSDSLPELPSSREAFNSCFDIEGTAEPYEVARDDMYAALATGLRREEILAELSHALPLNPAAKTKLASSTAGIVNHQNQDLLDIAKTYIRANVMTPAADYHPNAARAKLLPLGEAILDRALASLLETKILKQENKGRLIPGRNYSISDKFLNSFKQSLDPLSVFHAAVRYKQYLDHVFHEHGFIDFSYQAQDGDVLALLNLLAAGRVHVEVVLPPISAETSAVPTGGPRVLSKWGFTYGNYKTTQMDRDNLVFPIRVTPTEMYVDSIPFGDNAMPEIPAPHLGKGASATGIPVWYDIHDNLLPQMWRNMVAAVLTAVALRSGTGPENIVKMCKRGVHEWEVLCVLDWLEGVGAVRKTEEGVDGAGGWTTAEWWWCVFGSGMIS